jgi:hypothetical protein
MYECRRAGKQPSIRQKQWEIDGKKIRGRRRRYTKVYPNPMTQS